MSNPRLSSAAAALLRALLARANLQRDRILLMDCQSTDWQSLMYVGERHQIRLRLPPPEAEHLLDRMTGGLQDEEFALTGQIVADVAVEGVPERAADGSIILCIEALTIAE